MYHIIKLLRSRGLSWKAIGVELNDNPEKLRSCFRRSADTNKNNTKELNLPSEDLSLDQLLDRRKSDTSRRLAAAEARSDWLDFHMDRNVIMLALIGDPHLDDNYCNFNLLAQHVQLLKDNPDIFVVPLGDTTNNWAPKLYKEFADQDTTKTQSLQLIEWFFDSLKPRVHIRGNHDNWSGQESFISFIMSQQSGYEANWQAKCKLVFPNKFEYKCWFSHDFPGKSKTNPNYSEINRLNSAGEHIHLLAAGHRHYWSYQQSENEWTKEKYTLVRAKGYKDWDYYANVLGYGAQSSGHSIAVVVDSLSGAVTVFDDLQEGFNYYQYSKTNPAV